MVPEAERDAYAAEADAWVDASGGGLFTVRTRPSQPLGGSRRGRGAPSKSTFYELPPDALPEEQAG